MKETTSKAATTKFFSKLFNRKKLSYEQLHSCKTKISLDDTIKSINPHTNNRSTGNDYLIGRLYKQFSNEITPVLLDVYDTCGQICTMGATCRTAIISITYKKCNEKNIANCRPIYCKY